jgi:hypothetical protein
MFAVASLLSFLATWSVPAEGLITKPSIYPVDATLDHLEAALKERGSTTFTRLDPAAAA